MHPVPNIIKRVIYVSYVTAG